MRTSSVRTARTSSAAPARHHSLEQQVGGPAQKTGLAGLPDLGTNLTYTLDGDHLLIRIDLAQRHGKSASGKTTIVATSSGNQKIPGTEVVIGINAYVKP